MRWCTSEILAPAIVVAIVAIVIIVIMTAGLAACAHQSYDPLRATRPYPFEQHTTETVDIQVFRDGTKIQIVNSTARSYEDFDLWVNQRYMAHVDSMIAGETIQLSLWNFYDVYGRVFNAGGIFRTVEPTPVRLVEIQLGPEEPTIGLISIPIEEVREVTNPEQG